MAPLTLTLRLVAVEFQRKYCQNMFPAQPPDESKGVPKGLMRRGHREVHEPRVGRAVPSMSVGQV